MKKRVIIEKAPSSKKKVVIEGLPKAQIGKRIRKTSNVERDGVTLASLRNPFPKLTAPTQKKWQSWTSQNTENQPITAQDNVSDDIYYTPSKTESNANNSMSFIQNKKKIRKPGTTNFKFNVPHFYPNVGNKYLQQSVMDFNDAATYASNIGKSSKGINTPPTTYNPYVNMYYGKEGGHLPIAQWGYQSFQPSYTTPPSNLQPSNIEMPQYQVDQNPQLTPAAPSLTEGLQEIELNKNNYNNSSSADAWKTAGAIAGTVSKIGSGVTHALKGGLDIAGTIASNKGEQLAKDQLYTQSVFSDAMNVTPYETQGYGFQGRNGLAQDGMQIKQIGGMGEPNVEIEGQEHVLLPNGFSQEAQGNSHANGGIALNLPEGSKIYSEHLKLPVDFLRSLKEENNAPMAQEGMETGQSQPSDSSLSFLKYASLPKKGKISYADLAKKFETKKNADMLNAKYGDDIQKETAEMMIKFKKQKLEDLFAFQEGNKEDGMHGPEVQMNAMQNESSYGRYGLEMAKVGVKTGGTKKITIGNETVDASYYPKGQVPAGFTPVPGYPNYYQKITPGKPGTKGTPGTPAIPPVKDPYKGPLTTSAKWNAFLASPAGQKYKQKFVTGTPAIPGTTGTPEIPGAKEYAYVEDEQQNKPFAPQIVNKEYEIPGMNLNIGLPNIDERLRLNWYYPDYATIDPRYLDIQPELNTIGRAQRTVQGNLGSRGATDIANLLQAQANAGQQQQQAYGTKYNYDRAQDANAQQFNAQAYNQWAPQKQQSWYQQLEDPYRREESIIGTQKAMREQSDIENARQMQAFYNNKDYIENTFNPYKNLSREAAMELAFSSGNPLAQYYNIPTNKKKRKYFTDNTGDDDEEETTQKTKMGGKIKIKPTLKKRYK